MSVGYKLKQTSAEVQAAIDKIIALQPGSLDDIGIYIHDDSYWTEHNDFVPEQGALVAYTDTAKFKMGDGVTAVANLDFLDADLQNAVKFTAQILTAEQKAQARDNIDAGTYSKPAGGIPASDLADGVIPDVSDFVDADTLDEALEGKQDAIEDLEVIRAGAAAGATALQSFTETDPTVPSWAKQPDKPSYNYNEIGNTPDLSRFITKSVDDLVNYYLKSETYTKAEVQNLLATIQQFTYESVASLPTASSSTMHKIYLVPSDDPQTKNVKDEYITIESGGSYSWEQIGSTAIDLSGYVTTTALNTALASYTTTADLTTLLAAKQDVIDSSHKLDYSLIAKPLNGIPATDLSLEEEDLSNNAGKLQFADREYNTTTPNGLGYKILRKNASFASQVTDTNTIYVVRYNFDLGGSTFTIPAGCILRFDGGSISNGTLNLNGSCKVEGIGIKCEITNPSARETNLSAYLADTSDAVRNRSVLQALLDVGARIIVDTGSLSVSDYLEVKTRAVIIGTSSRPTITFPNSKGFVWTAQGGSTYNRVEHINVTASDNAFDFVNGGSTPRPNNVYFSYFNDLRVTSNNGHCFYAGDNKGQNGDTCCFDNVFESIYVIAPLGCGFYGISGNTMRFIKCRCGKCGVSVFYNCAGIFESFNGSWGLETPTVFKSRRLSNGAAVWLNCKFINCNFESFQSVLFDCYDVLAYHHLVFIGCSFYVTPNENGVVDYFPMNFAYVNELVWRNNTIDYYNNGTYDSTHDFWYIYRYQDMTYDVDRAFKVFYTIGSSSYNSYMTKIASTLGTGVSTAQYYNTSYKTISRLESGLIKADTIARTFKQIDITSTASPYLAMTASDWRAAYVFKLSASLDVAGNHTITYFGNPNIHTSVLWRNFAGTYQFIVKNGNTNRNFTFQPGSGNEGGFTTIDGNNVVIAPGETAKFTMYYSGSKAKYLVEPYNALNPVVGATRPTASLRVGLPFFDTTLNKPISYKGNGVWVDANGYTAAPSVGATADRPTLAATDAGFVYFDTTLGKQVVWNGTSWVENYVKPATGIPASELSLEEEDLANDDGKLQFADRAYNTTTPDGLGYKILRKGVSFASQVTEANTIYEIRYKFDLDSGSVTIPSDSVLKFEGGSVDNGTLNLNDCQVLGSDEWIGAQLAIEGKTKTPAMVDWFVGLDAEKIEKAISTFHVCHLGGRDYEITRPIEISSSFSLIGESLPENFGNHSRSQLIASAAINCLLNITKGSDFLSGSIEYVSFTSQASYIRQVDGIRWSTPNGPSRPLAIRGCNFKSLRYGLYCFYTDTTKSTNLYNLNIQSCNFSANDWGIYSTGRHGLGGVTIANSVIEQNISGGVYIYDSTANVYGAMASVDIRNNLLEGQAQPIYIKIAGSVNIEGNYFESSSAQAVYISGRNDVWSLARISGNYHSSNGVTGFTYQLNNCMVTALKDTGSINFNIEASKCVIQETHIDRRMVWVSCNVLFFAVTENESMIIDTPLHTLPITPDTIYDNVACLRTPSAATIGDGLNNATRTIAVGEYRIVAYVRCQHASAAWWFKDNANSVDFTRELANLGTDRLYKFVQDIKVSTQISGTNKVQYGWRPGAAGYLSGSGFNIYTNDKHYIPRTDVRNFPTNSFDYANLQNPKKGQVIQYPALSRPISYTGSVWKDADGYSPAVKYGTSANRPTLASTDVGFTYYDTTLGKQIVWDGTAWQESSTEISTDISADATSDTKAASPKAVYEEIHPAVEDAQPVTGMLPNKIYALGEIAQDTAFLLNDTDIDDSILNHYYFTFSMGATAYVVTWPSQITGWKGGSALVPTENHYYEVSIINGVASYMEV